MGDLLELAQADPQQAVTRIEGLPPELLAEPEVQLLLGELLAQAGLFDRARDIARDLVWLWPDDADAHHMLGYASESLGDDATARRHFLRTLELDQAQLAERPEHERRELLSTAEEHLAATIQQLPKDFQGRLLDVTFLIELLPLPEHVEAGLDPRILGLIEGQWHAGRQSMEPDSLPTRIVVFAANIAAEFPESADFTEQIRITVLHEIGHYFGLEEDDMARLGLD